MLYSIVDVETTGGSATRDKITEIAIILHDGQQIIDQFSTLLNPDCMIPYGITRLTGITMEMVADAPRFYEVAKRIIEITEGAVFVAHNVRFDYNFVREEFARLGYTFSRKQLCTVRMSRQAFPGIPSYGLDSLIRHFRIPCSDRHRALGDAEATTILFEKILVASNDLELKTGIRETKLPLGITRSMVDDLPDACGVYYLHNEEGGVVYVGKSINIRKRIIEHFSDHTEKAAKLQAQVAHISYQVTGSELVACLLESAEIKKLRPKNNKAQRQQSYPYAMYQYTDARGYIGFAVRRMDATTRKGVKLIGSYPTLTQAKGRLDRVQAMFRLCQHLVETPADHHGGACFAFHLKRCDGVCLGNETVEAYNERALQAQAFLTNYFNHDFLILDDGRTETEKSIILVQDGSYKGYGYIDASDFSAAIRFSKTNASLTIPESHPVVTSTDESSFTELLAAVTTCQGNPETNRIILGALARNKALRILKLS